MSQSQNLISQIYLKIGGSNAAPEIMQNLISIEVDDSLLLPDMFSIHLRDPDFNWANSDVFELGKAVEITANVEGVTKKLLSGEITAVESRLNQAAGATAIIRGYDQSHRLHRTKQTTTYVQQTDSDIAQTIARACGLRASVDNSSEVHKHISRDNQTDMEFLQARAQAIGYSMYVEDGTLYFCKAPAAESDTPVLEWGNNLSEFRARLTTAQQVTGVEVRSWDPKTKKEIIGRATKPQDTPKTGQKRTGGEAAKRAFNIDSKEIVTNHPVATQSEAESLAQSICDEMGNAFIQLEGACSGNPAVQAGAMIELKGVGKRFSGSYRNTHSLHRYDGHSYTTHFTVSGRRANTLADLLSTKKNGSSHGVVVGTVSNIQDPDKLGRVKLKLPTLLGEAESGWARVVTPMAGDGRGVEFMPEVNDEVLVAFEHDSIDYPYVLGSLWNGKDKPPEAIDQVVSGTGKVDKRIICSRSGHTITLDDSDGGAKISIVDKTGSNSFEIDSQNNSVTIKAQGDIQLDAMGKVKIKGSDVELEAMGQAKVKGTSNVTVEASGTVDVKGATINLN